MKKAKFALVLTALLTLAACGGSESSVSPSSTSDSTSAKESSSSKKSSKSSSSKDSSSKESSNDDSSLVSSEDSSSSEASSSTSTGPTAGSDKSVALPLTLGTAETVTNIDDNNSSWYVFSIVTTGTYSIKLSGGSSYYVKAFELYDSTSSTALTTGYTEDYESTVVVDYNFTTAGDYYIHTYYDDISGYPSYSYDYSLLVTTQLQGYSIATAIDVDMTTVETTGFDVSFDADEYAFYKFTMTADKYISFNFTNVTINSSYGSFYAYFKKGTPTSNSDYDNYTSTSSSSFSFSQKNALTSGTTYYLIFTSYYACSAHVTFTLADERIPDGSKSSPYAMNETDALSATGTDVTSSYSGTYYVLKASEVGKYAQLTLDLTNATVDIEVTAYYGSKEVSSKTFTAGSTNNILNLNYVTSATKNYKFCFEEYYSGATSHSLNVKVAYLDTLPENGDCLAAAITKNAGDLASTTGVSINPTYGETFYRFQPDDADDGKFAVLTFELPATNSEYYYAKYYESVTSASYKKYSYSDKTFSFSIATAVSSTSYYYFSLYSYYGTDPVTVKLSYNDMYMGEGTSTDPYIVTDSQWQNGYSYTYSYDSYYSSSNLYYKLTPSEADKYIYLEIANTGSDVAEFLVYDSNESYYYLIGFTINANSTKTVCIPTKTTANPDDYFIIYSSAYTYNTTGTLTVKATYNDDIIKDGYSKECALDLNLTEALSTTGTEISADYVGTYYQFTATNAEAGKYLIINVDLDATNTDYFTTVFYDAIDAEDYVFGKYDDASYSYTYSIALVEDQTYYFYFSGEEVTTLTTATIRLELSDTLTEDGKDFGTAFSMDENEAVNGTWTTQVGTDRSYWKYTPTASGDYFTYSFTNTGTESMYVVIYANDTDSYYEYNYLSAGDTYTSTYSKTISSDDVFYFAFYTYYNSTTVQATFSFNPTVTKDGSNFAAAYDIVEADAVSGTYTVDTPVDSTYYYYRYTPSSTYDGKYLKVTVTPGALTGSYGYLETYMYDDQNPSNYVRQDYDDAEYSFTYNVPLSSTNSYTFKFYAYSIASGTLKFEYLDTYSGAGDSDDPYIMSESDLTSSTGYTCDYEYFYTYYSFTTTADGKYMQFTIDATNAEVDVNYKFAPVEDEYDILADGTIEAGEIEVVTIETATVADSGYLFRLDADEYGDTDSVVVTLKYLDSLN